jgi:hypothetical protein
MLGQSKSRANLLTGLKMAFEHGADRIKVRRAKAMNLGSLAHGASPAGSG